MKSHSGRDIVWGSTIKITREGAGIVRKKKRIKNWKEKWERSGGQRDRRGKAKKAGKKLLERERGEKERGGGRGEGCEGGGRRWIYQSNLVTGRILLDSEKGKIKKESWKVEDEEDSSGRKNKWL